MLYQGGDPDYRVLLADRIAVMRQGKVVQFDNALNIIMHPADDFVAELVGADDTLRRLSLVSIPAAMVPLGNGVRVEGAEPRIDIAQRVRPALTLLLEEGAPRVIVEENGVPVGFLDLAAIQRASVPRVDGSAA